MSIKWVDLQDDEMNEILNKIISKTPGPKQKKMKRTRKENDNKKKEKEKESDDTNDDNDDIEYIIDDDDDKEDERYFPKRPNVCCVMMTYLGCIPCLWCCC